MSEKLTPRKEIARAKDPTSLEKEVGKIIKGAMEETNSYARYGYQELKQIEESLAKKFQLPEVAIMNCGMAAIHTTLEAENLKPHDCILCSNEVYGCTSNLLKKLQQGGIKVITFSPGQPEELYSLVKYLQPRCVIFESIANTKAMRMVDFKNLLLLIERLNQEIKDITPEVVLQDTLSKPYLPSKYSSLRKEEQDDLVTSIKEYQITNNPFCFRRVIKKISQRLQLDRREVIRDLAKVVSSVIKHTPSKIDILIDNTLPSPTIYNPLKDVGEGLETTVIICESGTKHYQSGKNSITFGLTYSNKPSKVTAIKRLRADLGTYLQPSSLEQIPEDSLERMESRVALQASNALWLAQQLQSLVLVHHPNLPNHPDKLLADQFAQSGIVTVFYLELNNLSSMEFVQRVYQTDPNHSIKLGASFGHDQTWLLPLGDNLVRVSAGSENSVQREKVLKILTKSLSIYN